MHIFSSGFFVVYALIVPSFVFPQVWHQICTRSLSTYIRLSQVWVFPKIAISAKEEHIALHCRTWYLNRNGCWSKTKKSRKEPDGIGIGSVSRLSLHTLLAAGCWLRFDSDLLFFWFGMLRCSCTAPHIHQRDRHELIVDLCRARSLIWVWHDMLACSRGMNYTLPFGFGAGKKRSKNLTFTDGGGDWGRGFRRWFWSVCSFASSWIVTFLLEHIFALNIDCDLWMKFNLKVNCIIGYCLETIAQNNCNWNGAVYIT